MGIRVFDATIGALVLISVIFFGMIFLIIGIPIFNYVNPFLLEMTVLGLFLGLPFGLIAGHWYTKLQLKVLCEKTEFKGLGSKKVYYALFSGFAIFLVYSFFVFYFRSDILGNSLVSFYVSATFLFLIIRLMLVYSWEKSAGKVVMMETNRFSTRFYTVTKQ